MIIAQLAADAYPFDKFFFRREPETKNGRERNAPCREATKSEFMGPKADRGPAAEIQRRACFWRRVRLSAIMAMNSEFVGLPLMFDTV